jgi:uncharacterized membrane protein (UPF0127 family)
MRYVTVCNRTRNVELGRRVRVAGSLIDRAVGLLSTPELAVGEGMYLSPCQSIHTFFMRYPIDVLFLDDQGAVIRQETVRPWRISGWLKKSRGVLELAAGTITRTQTQVGDRIELKGEN